MNLIFDGVDLQQVFGCEIFREDSDRAPAREVESVPIPGRTGDLLKDGRRYPNVSMTYALLFPDGDFSDCKNFLLSRRGYSRLEDSEHSDEYYMAYVKSDIEPTVTRQRDMAKYIVEFERKAQRYLKSGETVQTFTAAGSITNPTRFDAQPLLRVYGAGSVGIGSRSFTITSADEYTDIDCERMDCFKGVEPRNEYVQFTGHLFPVLPSGVTQLTFSGVTRIEVTPRWWRL